MQDADDPVAALRRAGGAGVDRLVCVGTDPDRSRRAVELAAGRGSDDGPEVFATVGLHPHDASAGTSPTAALLESLAAAPGGLRAARVVAVGECGLDYHYDHSPRDAQRRAFADQIGLAHRHGLALVIHTREAWDDTFDILRAERVPERTVFHCFTGGPGEARRCLDAGAHLSFSGIVSFPSAGELREAAALCPADRLLVETDSPYLTPVPHRGRPNEPAFVPLVGDAVAAARGDTPEQVAASSREAAARVLGLGG